MPRKGTRKKTLQETKPVDLTSRQLTSLKEVSIGDLRLKEYHPVEDQKNSNALPNIDVNDLAVWFLLPGVFPKKRGASGLQVLNGMKGEKSICLIHHAYDVLIVHPKEYTDGWDWRSPAKLFPRRNNAIRCLNQLLDMALKRPKEKWRLA